MFMIAGMKKAIPVMRIHRIPPNIYQVRTPSQSVTGPAINKLSGIIAVAPAPISEKTRPCMSGAIVDWKMAT